MMSSRKIYVLVVAMGLAMVWLGFLFTYELNMADHRTASRESFAVETSNRLQAAEEQAQTAGLSSEETAVETGTGFPLALAGLGLIFVLGGAFRFRHKA